MRTCTICRSVKRDEADRLLVEGATLRDVARRTALSKDALHRHVSAGHLAAKLAKAETAQNMEADEVVRELLELIAHTRAILQEARQNGRPELALRAIGKNQDLLELKVRAIVAARGSAASPDEDRVEAALAELRRRREQRRLDVAGKLVSGGLEND
jgi:formate dehydrogenase maturation protein FdhE